MGKSMRCTTPNTHRLAWRVHPVVCSCRVLLSCVPAGCVGGCGVRKGPTCTTLLTYVASTFQLFNFSDHVFFLWGGFSSQSCSSLQLHAELRITIVETDLRIIVEEIRIRK